MSEYMDQLDELLNGKKRQPSSYDMLAALPSTEVVEEKEEIAPTREPQSSGFNQDLLTRAIYSLGPGLLGGLTGSTGMKAALPAARDARELEKSDIAMASEQRKMKALEERQASANKEKKQAREFAEQKESNDEEYRKKSLDLRERSLKAGNERPGGKQMSASDVLKVNEGNAIPMMLADLGDTIEQNKDYFVPGVGTARALNPFDDTAKTIDSQLRSSSQAFGRFMEGGVLRKEDEEKYKKMFPSVGDTPEVAMNKLAIVKRLLVQKQKSNLDALKMSGYDVDGLKSADLSEVAIPEAIRKKDSNSNPGKVIAKTQTNQKTGQKRIVYTDGTIEIVGGAGGK